jgi:hypothetical protein
MDRPTLKLEELESRIDLVHETAVDTLRSIWAVAEEKGQDPSEFLRAVAWELQGFSSRLVFARPEPKKPSGRKRKPSG